MYAYRSHILEALAGHGVAPTPDTPPLLVRTFLNELYKWELRQLRNQVQRGTLPKRALADEVIVVRSRYRLLAIPVETWTDHSTADNLESPQRG